MIVKTDASICIYEEPEADAEEIIRYVERAVIPSMVVNPSAAEESLVFSPAKRDALLSELHHILTD